MDFERPGIKRWGFSERVRVNSGGFASASASASAKILDTPRLGITSRHTMVRVVHDKMLCPYMYSAG